jgi:transglutaminase-like putative cysteine protease
MRYALHHLTRFTYERPVSFARCNIRLRPIDWPGQRLIEHSFSSVPEGNFVSAPGNNALVNITRITLTGAMSALDITSTAEIEVDRLVPQIGPGDMAVAQVAAAARVSRDFGALSPVNFLYPSPMIAYDRAISDWCSPWLAPDQPATLAVFALAQNINQAFAFDPEATLTETLPAEAFAKRAGVCQDFAQVMITGLRAAGIPAAYASGYIRTIPPPGEARLQGADAMHGWVLAWCGPECGWVGYDPTNAILMASDHVLVAVGRDYLDIAPIDGIFTGFGAQEMRVEVDMVPVVVTESASP